MMKKTRTEITFETDRMFVVRQRRNPKRPHCGHCSEPVRMVTPDEIAHAAGVSARTIYRLVEAGKLHFTETQDGLLLVCINSLSAEGNTVSADSGIEQSRAEMRTCRKQCFEGAIEARKVVLDAATVPAEPMRKGGLQSLTHRKEAWALTSEAFDKLLDRLDSDREPAGHKYESIRRKLMKYFECRGCLSPEDLADETMNRVARRISEGSEIWTTDPASYFYGVARYVLKEYWGSPEREISALECLPPIAHPAQRPPSFDATQPERTAEPGLQALDHCIRALPAEDRELILQYYQGEKGDKIRNRQSIAKRLGIPLNALRIRVHRIRKRLEADVNEYLQHHE